MTDKIYLKDIAGYEEEKAEEALSKVRKAIKDAQAAANYMDYKAGLIKRVEYHLDGRLATVLMPFEDIQEYSDEYNPNVLILEELRMVQGVDVAISIKTYPDGKLTGKIRSTSPVADQIAGYFGGGGHPYAAGFRIYENYDETIKEIVGATIKALEITN